MSKKLHKLILALFLVLAVIVTGCASQSINPPPKEETNQEQQKENSEETKENELEEGKEETVDLAAIKANEAGKIMILEWHVIGEKEGRWARTYTNFRKDLETLYAKGYRLVSLRDVVTNNINIEAGYTPVVLTFDDGTAGHFRYIDQDGKRIIDPNSAVGILKGFSQEYPDFGLEATFYINYYTPFRQKDSWEDKLREVVELGMDLGNHTVNHPKLSTLTQEQVAEELGKMVKMVDEVVPGYDLDTLALPFGISPKDISWAVEGEYQGIKYHNKAVLLVGSGPIKSPVAKGYDATKLPRIQVFQEEFDKWLNYFEDNPGERYISDGNPDTVAIPSGNEDLIDEEKIGEKELIIYDAKAE